MGISSDTPAPSDWNSISSSDPHFALNFFGLSAKHFKPPSMKQYELRNSALYKPPATPDPDMSYLKPPGSVAFLHPNCVSIRTAQAVSCKTCVIVALASSRLRSEIQSLYILPHLHRFRQNNLDVPFQLDSTFVAKN